MRAAASLLFILSYSAAGAEPVQVRPTTPPVDEMVVRRLIEGLGDTDFDVRQNLAVSLAKIGPASVEPLIEALQDKNPDRRAGAAYALGLIGSGARAALPTLLDLLKDDDVGVRRSASYAISRIVPTGRAPTAVATKQPERGER